MNLHERVRKISQIYGVSLSEIGRRLGLASQTFNGYLKDKREDNLWPLLPKILEAFPGIRREWLYFEDGPMEGGDFSPPAPAPVDVSAPSETETHLRQRIAELEAELTEANRLNRRLMTRLLDETSAPEQITVVQAKAAGQ